MEIHVFNLCAIRSVDVSRCWVHLTGFSEMVGVEKYGLVSGAEKIARAERERDGIDERIRRDQHVCEREEERRDGKNEIAVCDFR